MNQLYGENMFMNLMEHCEQYTLSQIAVLEHHSQPLDFARLEASLKDYLSTVAASVIKKIQSDQTAVNPYRAEILISTMKDNRQPETYYFATESAAIDAVESRAGDAQFCYGKVFDHAGAEVFDVEPVELVERAGGLTI